MCLSKKTEKPNELSKQTCEYYPECHGMVPPIDIASNDVCEKAISEHDRGEAQHRLVLECYGNCLSEDREKQKSAILPIMAVFFTVWCLIERSVIAYIVIQPSTTTSSYGIMVVRKRWQAFDGWRQ
jgi:hypothetical protein